ncbi:MAG TPA: T9SS type A sorting domain-containing protein [Flavobacteriales bacterium]|nr:T9SS type A sorting domain-containing protein [Flavobacteriales bacterium]
MLMALNIEIKQPEGISLASRLGLLMLLALVTWLYSGELKAHQNFYFHPIDAASASNLKEETATNTGSNSGTPPVPLAADEFIMNGELTVNQGCLISVNTTFRISPTGTVNNSGTMELRDMVTVEGAMNGTGLNGNMVLNGTQSTQGVSTTGAGNSFHHLELDNPFGANLLSDCTVGGMLTLTNGVLSTDTNTLILTSTDPLDLPAADPPAPNFVYGNLRKHILSNTQNTYTFPVGLGALATHYFRADLTSNALVGVDYVTVSVSPITELPGDDGSIVATQDGTPIIDVHADAEWSITPNAAISSGTYDLDLYVGNTTSGIVSNTFTILKRPGNSTLYSDWQSHDGTTQIPASNAPGRVAGPGGFARKMGFDGFSKFGIGSGASPLPIELLYFNAVPNDQMVDVIWTTASEINNDFFTVERSKNGIDFEMLVELPGAGTSNQVLEYSSKDDTPYNGLSYYRLKQTDYDGKYEYSKTVAVNLQEPGKQYMYPNPAHDLLHIDLGDSLSNIQVVVESLNGQKVLFYTGASHSQIHTLDIKDISAGIYFLRIYSRDKNEVMRFIKL